MVLDIIYFCSILTDMGNRVLIGHIDKKVIELLGLDIKENTPIYISEGNIIHIRENHPDAYMKYYDDVENIISNPDYVGIAGVDAPSIEYIKQYKVDNEYVNIAVRASKAGTYFVRSMFIIEEGRINDYLKKGKLIQYKSPS